MGNKEENEDDDDEEEEDEDEGPERIVRLKGFVLDRADSEHMNFEKFTRTGYWFKER